MRHVTGYVPQSDDVSEVVERAQFDRLRQLTPIERLAMAVRATQALHRLSVAGLRLRFPPRAKRNWSVAPAR